MIVITIEDYKNLQSISCNVCNFFPAISYIIMFVYITFSLGQTGKCSFSRWEIRPFSSSLYSLCTLPNPGILIYFLVLYAAVSDIQASSLLLLSYGFQHS
jgi:hypothetical protein